MQFKLMNFRGLSYITLIFALAACGGGGSGDGADADNSSSTIPSYSYGFFIDDAVQGLVYQTGGGAAQVTDENGVFRFESGAPIEFRIDDVSLGSIASGLERITPADLNGPNVGLQVFRFLQSMDTTPGTPGIDLRGLDLPVTPINFSQANSFFENDPAVIAALSASQAAGATGILIDYTVARNNYLAGSNRVIAQMDFEELVAYPESVPGPTEPCLVYFKGNLNGESVCRDDIAADPANAAEDFIWFINGGLLVANIDADTQVVVTRNGTTGNRIHATVETRCLTCDPNLGPTSEFERQTFYSALPLGVLDFSGNVLNLTTGSGTTTATFTPTKVSFDDGSGIQTANWSVNPANNVLLLEGTGAPGASDLMFAKAILIDGSVGDGRFVVLSALVDDANSDGIANQAEFDINGIYTDIEIQTSTP